jgi:hypothetical protein
MGRVYLDVIEERVSHATWERIYERARRVANQWKPRPLAFGWRQIGGVRVAQYGPDIETDYGLSIIGDAETRTTGEGFLFPRRVGRAAARCATGGSLGTSDDVLVAVARRHEWPPAELARLTELFGDKTLGLPYHTLIVALGLLVETSLPGTAVVRGDISVDDGNEAQRGLASILGEAFELPVVVDAERVRKRLTAFMNADALDQATEALCPMDPYTQGLLGDMLARSDSAPGGRARHELKHVVLTCPDPGVLGADTRQLLNNLAETIRSGMVRMELRERVEQWGAVRTRETIARRVRDLGPQLTSMAWDAIEAAELDELAFLLGATYVDTTVGEGRRAVRAMLENRALRQLPHG